KIFAKTLDSVQPEDVDQGLPLLRLGLVDEVGKRASAKEEGFPPDGVEALSGPLVGEDGLPTERAAREDLDRRDAVGLATHVAHRVLAAFMGQKLNLAREVPLQRIGDRALAGAVVAVDDDALALPEIHGHLVRDSTERVHHETLDLFIHRRHPRTADGSPAIGPRRPSSGPPRNVERNPRADRPALRAASEETPVRSDGTSGALLVRKKANAPEEYEELLPGVNRDDDFTASRLQPDRGESPQYA